MNALVFFFAGRYGDIGRLPFIQSDLHIRILQSLSVPCPRPMVGCNVELTLTFEASEHPVVRGPIPSGRGDDQRVFAAGLEVSNHRLEHDDEPCIGEEQDYG